MIYLHTFTLTKYNTHNIFKLSPILQTQHWQVSIMQFSSGHGSTEVDNVIKSW